MEAVETSSLYLNEDVEAWQNALAAYGDVLQLKANNNGKAKRDRDLVALDKWYQDELPQNLKSRDKMYLNLDELCQLMKWKLTRGKFRPRLSDLVKANDGETVEKISLKAFECLPDVSSAVRELSKLKAVGPATASAILSAGAPNLVPFMADEAMMAIPNLGEINYNLPFYMKFVERIDEVLQRLKKKDPNGNWTAHKIELALWTEVMAKKYDFHLSQGAHTNGCNNGVDSRKRKSAEAPKGKKRAKKK
ncbi:uncharacterized protein LOC114529143 [Dendronephthya gigantea]|uniref:uncharacterized protein LOC114529143 n=1 Tax=Dendronephthya gigantea TaxID=151771 RepID=UPI00106C09A5|nr:uncharacterized protein LOC114529143 [Dendronephthya gigantea]